MEEGLLPMHKPKNGKRKLKIMDPLLVGSPDKQVEEVHKHIEETLYSDASSVMGKDKDANILLSHLQEYTEAPYTIIESYFEGHHLERLVRHQIESYNHFVNYQIQRTIQMFNPVTIHSENDFVAEKQQYFLEISISFSNFKLFPPQIHENNGATKTMFPQEAKLRNFTYASTMNLDIHIQYIIRNTESMDTPKIIEKTLPKINIGKLPIMLKSSICVLTQNKHIGSQFTGECSMDCGGYFIIKGSEKTVLGQERAAENRVYCFDGKNTAKWNWYAEIKSVPDFKCISPKQIEMMVASKNNGFGHGMYINIPRVKQPIELFVLFRALGVISDKDISQYVVLDIHDSKQADILQFLQASMIDANKYMTQEDALRHITAHVAYTPLNMDKETGARKKREFTQEVLDNDLFPHCQTPPQKLYMLGYMANKLIQTSLGLIPTDDRDSYINKRIELTGTLLNNLFRNYFNKLVKEMQKQIVREINTGSWRSTEDYENIINLTNIYKIMKSTTIENGINRALATGDFSIKQSNSSKVGVAQVLNRLTYVSSLSHLRRINTPLEKSGELIAPRKLHNTTWGYCCLTEDTEVLLSDRMTLRQIKDMKDGDTVTTVNPNTLLDEPSDIHSFFSKMPDKLFEVTTMSGRKVKATADHPFLVNRGGVCEWINMDALRDGDKLVIRHTVKNIVDTNTTEVRIFDTDVLPHYKMELLERNLLNINIPTNKLKIIARLLGALNTDGHLAERIDGDKKYYTAAFHVGEESDVFQLADDIANLGFGNVLMERTEGEKGWSVSKEGAFAYLLYLLGEGSAKTRVVPDWIMGAELSVKREFLSGFQNRNEYQTKDTNWPLNIGVTAQEGSEDAIAYMNQLVYMFSELGIRSTVNTNAVDEIQRQVYVVIEKSPENLATYADTIHDAYCDRKRRASAPIIERLKTQIFQSSVIKNDTDLVDILDNGCISVSVASIREIQPELVYDFTTRSENHSFVASSFVTHNCAAETPEGASIGIVKNISYLAHITIPTNSSSLYEYVKPHIRAVNDTDSYKLYGKVKVFVNGAWVGVSENPLELYQDLKDKKHKGIVNIYTSIVFDFKDLEIRICNDGGRLTRPVLRVRDNKALITDDIIDRLSKKEISWNDLLTNCKLNESVVEYIDPEEQKYSMIAMKSKDGYLQHEHFKFQYTHCEIHPSTIFGVLASCIPFPEHNQAPRNTYQCLSPDELVWMSDGTRKAIRDVTLGEKVLSFHPETLDITETTVVNHFVRPNDNPIYRVRTISGREIVATEDHKFMTNKGWVTVEEMSRNISDYKIGVSIHSPIFTMTNDRVPGDVIINGDTVRSELDRLGFTNKSINKYIKELTNQGLLPLHGNNTKLEIISRIIGYLLSDGSINIYIRNALTFAQCQFEFGMRDDAVEFERDLSLLGFNQCKILEGTREFNNVTHHTFHTSHNGALPAMLICLGVSYGKKTETARKEVPEWLMSDRDCRREFLKGFQGGDGCKIRWNKMDKRGYNFVCGETSQQIHPQHKESLIQFMNQCVSILRENNIIVSDVSEKKISEDRIKIAYKLSDKQQNLINYYDTIGYSYCQTKNNQSFVIVEYLKAKDEHAKKHAALIMDIRKDHDDGMDNSKIANKYGMKCGKVADAIRSYKNNRTISTPNINDFNIEKWINEYTEEKNNCLFLPIESITPEPDGLVSDIEVESENHSFIAGSNFLSSNCAMGKQAIGVYATNYDQRMDKTAYVLNYPGRPLVDTRVMNFIHLNKIPSGTQIHVAIMTHTGYNQEDSVLINKGSIDRGLFMATIYHTEKDEDKNIIRDEIIRCKPDPTKTKGIKFGNYDKLMPNGFIPENSIVENRDVIIAKTIPIKENRNDPTKTIKYEDQSKTFRTTEETYIDKNYTGRNGDGYNFAKVRVRTLRKPVLGDKFSSRHGQKGTIGNIIPECDMPFTKNGLRPDIIINPHAIPSRMTIGQLKETLLGKVLLELGMFGDGTSFGNLDVKTISTELQKLGYESYGNELMYNGLTGEQLETNIYIGPVFYQRLKHMVNDKQHSRSIGPMVNLTRQPAEGRSRDGGFRIGEMERDVMIAHGMTRFCKERLYDVSDKYSVHVCKKCGMIASYNDGNKNKMYAHADFSVHLCKTCNNMTDFVKVDIPYAYKLMSQELQTINIVPRLITE